MTDKEFDELMQHNPHARIVTDDKRLVTLEEYKQAQQATRQAAVRAAQATLPEPYEPEMQAQVIAWVQTQTNQALRWLFHTPNGEYRDKATAGKLSRMGINAGVPDLLLPWSNCQYMGLAIEMKRHPNKPTHPQLAWLEHLQGEGWRTEVCYSAQHAIDTIREYLDID